MFSRLGIIARTLALSLVAGTRSASAEPAWWTQQKRDCGLPASLAYNDWNGSCGSSSSSSSSSSQPAPPSAAELAEQARRQRVSAAWDANHQAIEHQKNGDWAKAVALFEEAARLSPDDEIIRDNLKRAKFEAEQAATYAEYRKRQEPLERAERELLRQASVRVRKSIQDLADSLNVATASNSRPSGLGFVAKLETLKKGAAAPDAFGTSKANPVIGTDPGSPEAASDQSQQGFDKAGPLTATQDARIDAKAIDGDPRMIAATRELATLRADRERLDAEIARLTEERNRTTDAAAMKTLSTKLDEKTREKQQKLVEIAETTIKTEKLRRTIETEVAAPKAPSGAAGDKEP